MTHYNKKGHLSILKQPGEGCALVGKKLSSCNVKCSPSKTSFPGSEEHSEEQPCAIHSRLQGHSQTLSSPCLPAFLYHLTLLAVSLACYSRQKHGTLLGFFLVYGFTANKHNSLCLNVFEAWAEIWMYRGGGWGWLAAKLRAVPGTMAGKGAWRSE